MMPQTKAGDWYGISAERITGLKPANTINQASGGVKALAPGSENNPAFSWVSLVVVLVIIRILWVLSD